MSKVKNIVIVLMLLAVLIGTSSADDTDDLSVKDEISARMLKALSTGSEISTRILKVFTGDGAPTPILKVDGSTSDKEVPVGTEVLLEISNAYPNWGVHFMSITDGYVELIPMTVADNNGYASANYTVTKNIEIYAYSDYGGGNSNSVNIHIPTVATPTPTPTPTVTATVTSTPIPTLTPTPIPTLTPTTVIGDYNNNDIMIVCGFVFGTIAFIALLYFINKRKK